MVCLEPEESSPGYHECRSSEIPHARGRLRHWQWLRKVAGAIFSVRNHCVAADRYRRSAGFRARVGETGKRSYCVPSRFCTKARSIGQLPSNCAPSVRKVPEVNTPLKSAGLGV